MRNDRIIEQVRRNAVALISLVVAITSLGYNTWRNEHSENNRNQRLASFEILNKLGELGELINLNHFDCNTVLRGNPRTGWVLIQSIQDLTRVLEDISPESGDILKDVWAENHAALDYESQAACTGRSESRRDSGYVAVMSIREAIQVMRQDVLDILYSLD